MHRDRHAELRVLGRQHRRDRGLQLRQEGVREGQPRRDHQPEGLAVRPVLLGHRPRHPVRQRARRVPRRLHDDRQVQQGRYAARRVAVLHPGRGRRVPAGAVGRDQVQRRPVRRPAPDRHDLHRLQQEGVRDGRHHRRARPRSRTPGRGRSSPTCATKLRASLPDNKFPFAYDWTQAGAFRWLSWLYQAGGTLLTEDLSSCALPSDAGTQGAGLHQELLHQEVGAGQQHHQDQRRTRTTSSSTRPSR